MGPHRQSQSADLDMAGTRTGHSNQGINVMNVQLASDLHLEFLQRKWPGERLIAPVPEADVLVLAGDIADSAQACELFADWPSTKPRHIVYVAGNHEFYGHPMDPIYQKLRDAAAVNNIHFLEMDGVAIDGVRFLGATLWTDYRLNLNRTQSQLMAYAEKGLNDHLRIRVGSTPFTAAHALKRHEAARKWLTTELAKPFDGKTVVVTHHGPHPLSVHPRYIGNELNAAFVSDLSELMPQVDLWLHGHVHDSFNYRVGRCRVVANPAGYICNLRYATSAQDIILENAAFNSHLLVEV
jgi:Icc-related predicted phosphoesterase